MERRIQFRFAKRDMGRNGCRGFPKCSANLSSLRNVFMLRNITQATKEDEATDPHNSRHYNLGRRPAYEEVSFEQFQTQ